MNTIAFFNGLVALSCGYALLRGGGPERVCAGIILAGVAITIATLPKGLHHFGHVETDIAAIDLGMLAAFQLLALTANRFWPLWVAGAQQATMLVHVSRFVAPEMMPWGYAVGLKGWAYMIVVLLGIGTFRHRRRIGRHGHDRGWSALVTAMRNAP